MGTNLTILISFLLTLAVNTYELPHTSQSVCPPYSNGPIAGSACSQEYTLCVNGIQQLAICQEGFVFYETACVSVETSPECQPIDEQTQEQPTQNEEQPTQNEEQPTFDCSTRKDGSYSVGCSNEFVQCSGGQAWSMHCPSNLVYVAEYDICLDSCDAIPVTEAPQIETSSTQAPSSDEVYDEPTITTPSANEQFDCSNEDDGDYVQGCSSVYYTCSNGITYVSQCPAGLVYNANQKACESDCDSTTTTTPATTSTTTEQIAEEEPIVDTYGAIPAEEVTTTTSETEVSASSLTTTASTTTTEEAVTSTEEVVPSTAIVEETTIAENDVPVVVASSTAEPAIVVPSGYSVASDVEVCQNGQITSFGRCASRFTKCQNNVIVNKQCPVNTLFESDVLLCVFDLPQCQPTVTPIQQYFPQPDIVVSPFDDSVALKPRRRHQIHRRGPPRFFEPQPLIDNPFFVPPPNVHRPPTHFRRRHPRRRFSGQLTDSPFANPFYRRAYVSDSYSDNRRINQGKLAYGSYKKAQGDRQFLVKDSFEGVRPSGFHSTVNNVFPKSATPLEVEGSGFNPQEDNQPPQPEAVRRKRYAPISAPSTTSTYSNVQFNTRQAQVNQNCQGVTTPQFFNFGQCFDEFIYCSGTGINRFAACPIGEHFDTTTNTCSSTCGNASVVTSVGDDSSSGYVVISSSTIAPLGDDQTASESAATTGVETVTVPVSETTEAASASTTTIPVGDVCNGISDEYIAIGCSQEFIHCSNGVAIRRACPAALYFDESKSSCDYRQEVAACTGKTDDVPTVFHTTSTSTGQPQLVQVLESTYAPSISPYRPNETTFTNGYDQVVSACEGLDDGPHGKGCSASYIVCTAGKLTETLICSLGEGFDSSVGGCVNLEDISGVVCSQSTTESTIAVIGDDEGTFENTTPEAQSNVYNTNAQTCQSGARASVGFCVANYLECVENAYISQSCEADQLFDSHSNKCVSKEHCVHGTITKIVHQVIEANGQADSPQESGYRSSDRKCSSFSNNTLISTGSCRKTFIRCVDSKSSIEACQQNQVFCTVQLKCVDKWSVPKCARAAFAAARSPYGRVPQAQPYNYGGVAADASDAFCQGKSDGLYKSPSDCSEILQCSGGELFNYPACPSHLAFNEVSGKCDYPQNVDGCDVKQDDQGEADGCVHGAFIANPENCSIFYRCVWGRRVEMICPSGTVFNPSLSVCDWPSAVPSCTST